MPGRSEPWSISIWFENGGAGLSMDVPQVENYVPQPGYLAPDSACNRWNMGLEPVINSPPLYLTAPQPAQKFDAGLRRTRGRKRALLLNNGKNASIGYQILVEKSGLLHMYQDKLYNCTISRLQLYNITTSYHIEI